MISDRILWIEFTDYYGILLKTSEYAVYISFTYYEDIKNQNVAYF